MTLKSNPGDTLPSIADEARAVIDRLLLKAEELVRSDPEQALRLADQAATACKRYPFDVVPYQKGLARSLHASASAYLDLANYGLALKLYSDALAIYQEIKDQSQIAAQLNNIGIIYAYCGVYDEALANLRAAESLLTERTPLDLKAEILNNIGFAYVTLGDYANAVPYLLKSLEAANLMKQGDKSANLIVQANIHDSLCQAYLALNNLDAALAAGLTSTALCHQSGDLRKEAEYLLSLGEVYVRLKDPEHAISCYQRSLGLARGHGFRREEADGLRKMGTLLSRSGDSVQAKRLLSEALSIAQEINIPREVYECHQALSSLYKQAGEFEKALEHYESFHQIKETLFNDQSDQRIKNLEMIHQVEQARRESEIYQQKSIELQKEIDERKKAQELTEVYARIDSLTGVFNRRHFFAIAQERIHDTFQQQAPLSILIGDLDHFKAINDRFGHLEGDRVLTAIAHKISAMLRKDDIVGRYGGEEFVILLPVTNADLAILVAERLRASIATMKISADYPALRTTISIGIASLQGDLGQDEQSLERLLSEADQAMYAAKRLGRNRVIAFPLEEKNPEE